jgi:hypothetical protein
MELGRLWTVARRHALRPLAARALRARGVELPPSIQGDVLALSADSLRFTQALLEIQDEFSAKSIRLLGYKGPALSALLHGNVAMREFVDIDVLISTNDLSAAVNILEQLGYVSDQKLTPKQDRDFRKTASNFTFLHPETRVSIELHWQIAHRFSGIAFDFEDLWQRRFAVDLGNGQAIATFSPSDQLLILALHGARHFWESLGWVADIAYLLQRNDLDFDTVWPRAKSLRLTGMTAWALRFTQECFGGAPRSIPNEVSLSSIDHALSLSYHRANAESIPPELTFAEHFAFAALLESLSTRLAYFTRLLFTPGTADWADRDLPEHMHFAYPMVRISRVLRKSVRPAK